MNIELGVLNDGNVLLVSDQPLPDIVQRVEYYREQRQFLLVYHRADLAEQIMEYELPVALAHAVERTPNIMIYSLFPNREPIGYKAPLVQIGSND